MKEKWYIRYEKNYLISTINRNRLLNGNYNYVKDIQHLNRILKKERQPDETEIDTVKRLIYEIKTGQKTI